MVVRYIAGDIGDSLLPPSPSLSLLSPVQVESNIRQGIGINNVDGKGGGIYVEGFLLFCCVILAMQYKAALMTSLWTWIHVTAWLLSLAGLRVALCLLLTPPLLLLSLSWTGFILFASVYSQIVEVWDWYHVVNFSFHQVPSLSLLLALTHRRECIGSPFSSSPRPSP
jgi:hypothetical protein